MTDWKQVFDLPWYRRDARIEAETRTYLTSHKGVLTTTELSKVLDPSGEFCVPLGARLTTMAPYLTPFAHHDGEEYKRFGRTMRRWNWYGQAGTIS